MKPENELKPDQVYSLICNLNGDGALAAYPAHTRIPIVGAIRFAYVDEPKAKVRIFMEIACKQVVVSDLLFSQVEAFVSAAKAKFAKVEGL